MKTPKAPKPTAEEQFFRSKRDKRIEDNSRKLAAGKRLRQGKRTTQSILLGGSATGRSSLGVGY